MGRIRMRLAAAVVGAVVGGWATGPATGQVSSDYARDLNVLPYHDIEVEEMRRVCGLTPAEAAEVDRTLAEWLAELEPLGNVADALMAADDKVPPDRRTAEARERLIRQLRELQQRQGEIDTRFSRRLEQFIERDGGDRWGAFERFRRRFRVMFALGDAAAVNVLALVEQFGPSEEERAALSPVLEAYEREVDRALAVAQRCRTAVLTAAREAREAGRDTSDERVRAALETEVEAARRVGRVNRDFAYRAAATLPVERGARLKEAFDRAAYPEAYGPFLAGTAVLEAAGLAEDLDEGTAAAVRRCASEWAAADGVLVREIVAMYREREGGDMRRFEGHDSEWDLVRQERWRLAGETLDAIKGLIGEEGRQEAIRRADAREQAASRAWVR